MAIAAREHAHAAVNRLAINRLGLWLFLLSDSFFFGAIISTRYFLEQLTKPEGVNQESPKAGKPGLGGAGPGP